MRATPRADAVSCFLVAIALLAAAHAVTFDPGEPFFNNDETRHVMTGVFFRDFIHDWPLKNPVQYATRYYLQYPALGLFVWPPLFHATLGVAMSAFGTSIGVAKVLVGLFSALAGLYLYLLVLRTHGEPVEAAFTLLLFGFAPLVFTYSSFVMLEIPTLAFSLASTFHFVRYLDDGARRDLFAATLFAAAAALTRFDAVFLLLVFAILIVGRQRLRVLLRPEILAAAVLGLLVVLPVYVITAVEVGSAHLTAASEGTVDGQGGFLAAGNLGYYPGYVPAQMSWVAAAFAVAGIGSVVWRRDGRALPYLAMVLATYVTFTPMAELDTRHAIYWVPGLALLAVEGARLVGRLARDERLSILVCLIVVAAAAATTLTRPRRSVAGYEAAAGYVVAHGGSERMCLFDGRLNGDFIYQMRRQDPARRTWVLRGDKVLYSTFGDFERQYQEIARDSDGVLDTIFKYDVAYVVVEQPGVPLRIAQALRAMLRERPDRFRLEATIPVRGMPPPFDATRLEIYRSLLRNEHPADRIDVDLHMLRRRVETDRPER